MSMQGFAGRFRITMWVAALVLGWFAIASILAEAMTPATASFTEALASGDRASANGAPDWPAQAAPLRGDMLSKIALARAAPVLKVGKGPRASETGELQGNALALARRSVLLAPHLSTSWLLIAALQNLGPAPGGGAEALKMSYLTSPANMDLIPARLGILAASAAIDPELSELGRNDIRLILTRRPDMKDAIIRAYRSGSPAGKTYIQDVVRPFDPEFAGSLR